MVKSENRVVYITIEKRHREFDSKTLVAAELLARGATVVIGYTYGVLGTLRHSPRGILYIKGLNKGQYNMVKDVPQLGHLIVATDEEAVGSCDPAFIMQDCWKDTASVLHMVLCQGEVHRQALIELRGFSQAQTVITGNARLDLLRPPFSAPAHQRAEEIRDEFGRFTLINTDCGFVNSAVMDVNQSREVLAAIGFIDPKNPDDLALMEEIFTYDRNNLEAIEDFIRSMERDQPERRLVLRPHPAEREDTWRKIEREVSNLTIVTNTPAPEWIAAADCVIQTGCTTGVEAAILGTPTIGLCCHPETLRYPRWLLSNEINPVVRSMDAALAAVRDLDANPDGVFGAHMRGKRERLSPHLDIDPDHFAFEKIADAIETMLPARTDHNVCSSIAISAGDDALLRKHFVLTSLQAAEFKMPDLMGRLEEIDRFPIDRLRVRDVGWSTFVLELP